MITKKLSCQKWTSQTVSYAYVLSCVAANLQSPYNSIGCFGPKMTLEEISNFPRGACLYRPP